VKQLLVLVAGVLVILGAWWLVGLFGKSATGPAQLVLPADLNDKPALIRSANQLWNAHPGYYDSAACIGLLARLAESLDDQQWRAVTSPVFFAWENLRTMTEVRGSLSSLNQKLLRRFASNGTTYDLNGLVRASNAKSFDAAAINAALDAIVAVPLPPSGLEGTRLLDLVVASLWAGDVPRAKGYLSSVRWESAPGADATSFLDRLKSMIDVTLAAANGKLDGLAMVRCWQEQGASPAGRSVLRPILEGLALQVMETSDPLGAGIKPTDLFAASAAEPGAEHFWNRIATRFVGSCAQGSEMKNANMAGLLARYSEKFKKPDYGVPFWMKAGTLVLTHFPGDPLRAVKLFERALAASLTDAQRIEAIRNIVPACLKAQEFLKARSVVEAGLARVTDAAIKKELEALLADVRKRTTADEARVELQKKSIDRDLRRGRLQNMKDVLVEARKSGRPPEQLQALERAIRDLEKDVTE